MQNEIFKAERETTMKKTYSMNATGIISRTDSGLVWLSINGKIYGIEEAISKMLADVPEHENVYGNLCITIETETQLLEINGENAEMKGDE